MSVSKFLLLNNPTALLNRQFKMHIKTIRSALITNYEVLRLLEESQEAQKQVQKLDPSVEYPEHLRTIQFEVIFFLYKRSA